MRKFYILNNYSNKKIIRYLIRILILIFALIVLKKFLYKLFTYDDLIDDIKSRNLKAVQLLTGRFDFKNWEFDELGEAPFRNCPESRCYAFRSLDLVHIPNEKSDGIMVHGPNLWYMPSRKTYKRNPRQLWLFYTMESQGLTFCSSHYELTDLDDWFNITATFKHDSTLYVDYKQFRDWNDVVYDNDYLFEFRKFLNNNGGRNPIEIITDLSQKDEKTLVCINLFLYLKIKDTCCKK